MNEQEKPSALDDALDELYNVQFVDNTNIEAAEAKRNVIQIVRNLATAKDRELAALRARLTAAEKAIDFFEWDEVTGECLMTCGGCAADGHNVGCQYVEKLVELGLMKIESERA